MFVDQLRDRKDVDFLYTPAPARDAPRPVMCPCGFCGASVDREEVAAARHLLYVCPKAPPEAKAVARKALDELRAKREREQRQRDRAEGVSLEQQELSIARLRADDYELAGPPPDRPWRGEGS